MPFSINVINLLVKDYDEALKFYTEKLGFKLKHDVPYEVQGQSYRFVAITPPEQPELAVSLLVAMPQDEDLVGRQGGGYHFLTLYVADAKAALAEMKARGVEISMDLFETPGGLGFNMKDLYGNTHHVLQPAEAYK